MKKMTKSLIAALALGLAMGGVAHARSDIKDGNAIVKPAKDSRYSIDGNTFDKATLYGYLGDLRDTDHITGIVLKSGGDDEQRRIIGVIAKTLGLKSFEQDGGDLKEIPQPETKPAPPPIEEPAAPSAADQGVPAADTTAPTDAPPPNSTLPPEKRSSEETVQPESETLFY